MAYSIPAPDLADLLRAAAGNADETSLWRAIENLYAVGADSEFTRLVSQDELSMAMLWLLHDSELIGFSDFEAFSATLDRFRLSDAVPLMMRHEGLYVNDEGEYWL